MFHIELVVICWSAGNTLLLPQIALFSDVLEMVIRSHRFAPSINLNRPKLWKNQ